jgi:hypothetical protein
MHALAWRTGATLAPLDFKGALTFRGLSYLGQQGPLRPMVTITFLGMLIAALTAAAAGAISTSDA